MKKAIETTATPYLIINDSNIKDEVSKRNVPIAYIDEISSNASNTVIVDIKADVISDQPSNIPIAKITSAEYTKEKTLKMIEVFFGNTTLYSKTAIKEDYDLFILEKQYQMNDSEQLQAFADIREITDLSIAKELIQEAIDRAVINRANAPEEREIIDIDVAANSNNKFDYLVKTKYGYLGRVRSGIIMTAFNDDNNDYAYRDLENFSYVESTCDNKEFVNAKQMAINMINDMELDNILYRDAYIAKDMVHNDSGVYWNGREYYVFCFDTIVGESVIDNNETLIIPPALVDVSGKDGYENVIPIRYDNILPYDRVEIWIEGDRIVQFKSVYPIKVTQIVNNNVAIEIDYPEAVDIAKQFAYTAFIDPRSNSLQCKLNITRIELVLVRIKGKDTGDYLVVPAWNLCGSYSRKVNPDNKNSLAMADNNGWITGQGIESATDALITVNALDGTVIDLAHGY